MDKDNLKLIGQEEKKERNLQEALIEGEDSGMIQNFNPKSHLKNLHQKKENENRQG
jgi:antitoxin ParD1/3/4